MPETCRLPVLGLLGDALRDVFGNLGGLARIAWPYYALAAVSAVLGFALAGGSVVAEAAASVLGPGTASILTGAGRPRLHRQVAAPRGAGRAAGRDRAAERARAALLPLERR